MRFYVFNSLPADADASGPWTTPWGPWLELAPWLGSTRKRSSFPPKKQRGLAQTWPLKGTFVVRETIIICVHPNQDILAFRRQKKLQLVPGAFQIHVKAKGKTIRSWWRSLMYGGQKRSTELWGGMRVTGEHEGDAWLSWLQGNHSSDTRVWAWLHVWWLGLVCFGMKWAEVRKALI